MHLIFHLLRGVAIGLANIIPGVSGGTMALLLGIYDRLIRALGNIGPSTFLSIFRGKDAFFEEMRRVEAVMISAIVVGAGIAVVASAKLLVYLLNHHHDPTYGFFFGLVLVSIIVPYRMVQKLSVGAIVAGLLGVTLVVGVTMGLSGERRVASARQKAAMKAAKAQARADTTGGDVQDKSAATSTATKKRYTVHIDAQNSLVFFGAGSIAISAMILPGISGSFVLLLMGVYFDILASINERNVVMLGIFSLGCLAGLLLFSRLIKFMLNRFRDVTLTFLTGLVAGSLYAIWPFKSFAFVGDHRVDKSNILPASFGANEITTVLTVIVGAAIVAAFIWIETKQQKGDHDETEAAA